jgi:sulfide:quinone oxidoreductase
VAIDGPAHIATFEQKRGDGEHPRVEEFDMIHVVPPQSRPISSGSSPLAAPSGFVEVDEETLRHVPATPMSSRWAMPARARTPRPLRPCASRHRWWRSTCWRRSKAGSRCRRLRWLWLLPADGREAGKIVLAEFGYGGKLLPSFPEWLIDGTKPSRLAWLLKDTILPPVYWHGMLKGAKWLVKPHLIGR